MSFTFLPLSPITFHIFLSLHTTAVLNHAAVLNIIELKYNIDLNGNVNAADDWCSFLAQCIAHKLYCASAASEPNLSKLKIRKEKEVAEFVTFGSHFEK